MIQIKHSKKKLDIASTLEENFTNITRIHGLETKIRTLHEKYLLMKPRTGDIAMIIDDLEFFFHDTIFMQKERNFESENGKF